MGTQQNMTLGIDVVANTQNAQAGAEKLRNTFQEAGKAAGNIRPASQTYAASAAKPTGGTVDPGLNRGASGAGGGAAASDFARQAQGLGGLVHVYATFAANLFAVSAAFTALSKAADMTNMIQGLDQLGAASGKNMGTMAKNLVTLTDGALSLKSAMEATSQASAAGITGTQLNQLTMIAKNASQALGRDMTDAMSRLVKGAAKIEPELLDELGLMVRVDVAAQNYARTLGKTVSSLSQFEKQQSFTIEMIKQGTEKFAGINVDANPYNKLLASLTNLALQAGAFINTVLGPIAKLLADSPMGLATVMGLIATKLLTQAIPALTQFKTQMFETAIAQNTLAKATATAAQAFDSEGKMAKGLQLAKPYEDAALAAQREMTTSLALMNSKKLANAADKAEFQATQEFRDKIANAQENHDTKAMIAREKQMAAEKEMNSVAAKKAERSAVYHEQEAARAADALRAADLSITKMKEANRIKDDWEAKGSTNAGRGTVGGALDANAKAAANSFARMAVQAAVVNDVKLGGIGYAIDQLKKNIAGTTIELMNSKGEMEKFTKVPIEGMAAKFALITGSARALGSAIMIIASSLGNVMMAFGVFAAVFEILDGWFNKNSKSIEAFKNSMDTMKESVEGADRTIDLISKKDPLEQLNAKSVQAKANALSGLMDSLDKVSEGLHKTQGDFANAADASWAGIIDAFKRTVSLIPGVKWDLQSKLADSVGKEVVAAAKLTAGGPYAEQTRRLIKEIFNVDSPLDVEKMLNNSNLSPQVLDAMVSNFKSRMGKINQEINNGASRATSFNDSLVALGKQFDTIMVSFQPTDAMSKFGVLQIQSAQALSKSLQDGTEALVNLNNAFKDTNTLKLFPAETLAGMERYIKNITIITDVYAKAKTSVEFYTKSLEELEKKKLKTNETTAAWVPTDSIEIETNKKAEESLKNQKKMAEGLVVLYGNQINKGIEQGRETAKNMFEDGIKNLDIGINKVVKEAAINFQRTINSTLTGAQAAKAETSLKLAENSIQVKALEAQKALLLNSEFSTSIMEKNNLELLRNSMALEERNALDKKVDMSPTSEYGVKRAKDQSSLDKGEAEAKVKDKFKEMISGKNAMDPLTAMKQLGVENSSTYSQLAIAIAGVNAQLKALGINAAGIKFSGMIAGAKGEVEDLKKVNDSKRSGLDIRIKEIEEVQKYLTIYDSVLSKSKEDAIQQKENLSISEAEFKLEKDIEVATKLNMADKSKDKEANIAAREQVLNLERKALEDLRKSTEDARGSRMNTDSAAEKASNEATIAYKEKIKKLDQDIRISSLNASNDQLEAAHSLGLIADQEYISSKLANDLALLNISYEQKKADVKLASIKEIDAAQKAIDAAKGMKTGTTELDKDRAAALSRAEEQMTRATTYVDKQNQALDEGNKLLVDKATLSAGVAEAMLTWGTFLPDVENGLRDALMQGFETGGKDGGKKFIDTLKAALKNAALKVVVNALISTGGSMLMNGVAQATGMGGTGGAFQTASGGASIYNAGTSGLTGLSGFSGGYSAGVAGVDAGLSASFISEGATGASGFGASTGAWMAETFGSGFATAIPYIGWALAAISVISSFMGKGGGPKTEGGVAGIMSSIGGLTKDLTQTKPYTGSGADADMTKLAGGISLGISNLLRSIGGSSQGLGISVGYNTDPAGTAPDNVASYLRDKSGKTVYGQTFDTSRGGAGEALTLEAKKLTLASVLAAEGIKKIYTDIAKGVNLVSATSSELDTALTKIGDVVQLVKGFEQLGWNTEKLTTDLIDAAGGAQALGQGLATYYENFYTDEEKKAAVTKQLSSSFAALNLTMPTTREEFRNMVVTASNDLTDTGKATFTALLGLSGAFASITDPIIETANAIVVLTNSMFPDLIKEYASLEVQLLNAMGRTAEAKAKQRDIDIVGMKAESVAQYDLNQKRKDEIAALNTLNGLTKTYATLEIQLLTEQGNLTAAKQRQYDIDTEGMDAVSKSQYELNKAREEEITHLKNLKTAITLLTGISSELDDLGLTPLQKSLKDITTKATGYKKQLSDLGLTTAENTTAVDEWERTMKGVANIKDAISAMQKIVAIMDQIASFKDSLQANVQSIRDASPGFDKLNATLEQGGLITQRTDLNAQLKTATKVEDKLKIGAKLQTNLMDSYNYELAQAQKAAEKSATDANERNQASDEAATAASALSNQMWNALKSMKDYAKGLTALFLSPINSLIFLKSKFDKSLTDTKIGTLDKRIAAAGELQGNAQAYLDVAKGQARTAVEYATMVAEVQSGINDIADTQSQYDEKALTFKTAAVTADWQVDQTRLGNDYIALLDKLKADTDTWQKEQQTAFDAQTLLIKTQAETINTQLPAISALLTGLDTRIGDAVSGVIANIVPTAATIGTALTVALDASTLFTATQAIAAKVPDASSSTLGILPATVATAATTVAAAATTVAAAVQTAATATLAATTAIIDTTPAAVIDTTPVAVTTAPVVPKLWDYWDNLNNYTGGFAAGGDHPGGLRMVGENGPELEATGPSRIFSHSSTAKMLGQANVDLIREIQELRKLMAEQQVAINNIAASTKSTKDTLIRVTRDGEGMQIASGSEIPVTLIA